MKHLKFFLKYIRYYLTAQTKHDIHSPFVFDLLTNIIEDKTPFYVYKNIEAVRSKMLLSTETIDVLDFGVGSESVDKKRKKKIKTIAKYSAKSEKYCFLLFRLVNHFQPQTILELGTSLGISTLYLASPNSKSKIITLEGCSQTAEVAKHNFEQLKLKNIEQVVGNFDETLKVVLEKYCKLQTANCKLDLVFFDGNHRKAPTIRYFEQCLNFSNENSVFIFDDIHWSQEMEEAWSAIKNHPQVTITIDLFFLGLVFFRGGISKQHFTLRF